MDTKDKINKAFHFNLVYKLKYNDCKDIIYGQAISTGILIFKVNNGNTSQGCEHVIIYVHQA